MGEEQNQLLNGDMRDLKMYICCSNMANTGSSYANISEEFSPILGHRFRAGSAKFGERQIRPWQTWITFMNQPTKGGQKGYNTGRGRLGTWYLKRYTRVGDNKSTDIEKGRLSQSLEKMDRRLLIAERVKQYRSYAYRCFLVVCREMGASQHELLSEVVCVCVITTELRPM